MKITEQKQENQTTKARKTLPRVKAIKNTEESTKHLGGGRFKPPPAVLYSKVVCG